MFNFLNNGLVCESILLKVILRMAFFILMFMGSNVVLVVQVQILMQYSMRLKTGFKTGYLLSKKPFTSFIRF